MTQQHHFCSSALTLSLLLCFTSVSEGAAQDNARLKLARGSVVVVPAHYECYPVEVKGIYLGGGPVHVVLGEVDIQNHSDKRVTAVRLAWMVHPRPVTGNHAPQCGIPPAAKAVLNGKTPLIPVGLEAKETCHIGPNPLMFKSKAPKTVFVDFPIIDANDLLSLDVGAGVGPKYIIALFVSEIHYGDGTTWSLER